MGFHAPVILKHRGLVWAMAKREIQGRYRGSALGVAWSFVYPVLMLAVYTFVFGVIFKSRWGGAAVAAGEPISRFAIILFAGLVVYGMFAESISKAPALITSNAAYVKKVVFPLEILPVASVIAAVVHMCVGLLVLLLAQLLTAGALPWTALAFPVVVLPFVLATTGLSWALAATGTYLRDLAQVAPLFATVMLFLAPVFYPLSAVPEAFRPLIEMNPVTGLVDAVRGVLVFGRLPDLQWLCWQYVSAFIIALLGLAWFRLLRRGFADVL